VTIPSIKTTIHEYPMPSKGVNLNSSIVDIAPDEALEMKNCIWNGGVKKRGGQSILNTSEAVASKKILGLHRFYYGSSKTRLVACDTKVMKDDEDNTWTDIKTGLTTGLQTHFSTWGVVNRTFVANGTDTAFVIKNDLSAVDITGSGAPASPTMFLPYQDRMLAIQGGDLVWTRSFPAAPETDTWETVANTGVRPDTVLYGMVHHSLTNSEAGYQTKVLLAGATDMYIFGGTSLNVAIGDYTIYPLGIGVGCNAPRTMKWTPKGTMWLGADRRVYLLPFGASTPIVVSKQIHSTSDYEGIENIPAGQVENACAVYHDGYYKLSVARSGQTSNNSQWWLEIDRLIQKPDGYYGPWYGPMLGRTISCYEVQDGPADIGQLIAGESTDKGFIYEMDVLSTTSDYDPAAATTKAIDCRYKSFNNPLGQLALAKDVHKIELELRDINGTVDIEYHDITGAVKSGDSISLSGGALKWDNTFTWDGSRTWGRGEAPLRQVLNLSPNLQARRLAIIANHNSSSEKFELYAIRAEAIEQDIVFA